MSKAGIHVLVGGVQHHRCPTCERLFPDSEFQKNKSRAWGIYSYCRECRGARLARQYAELRKAIIEHYGGQCACCGETEYVFLDFDHIDGGGSQDRKERGQGRKFLKSLQRSGYPDTLRVLCSNCNQARRRVGRCPHEIAREVVA